MSVNLIMVESLNGYTSINEKDNLNWRTDDDLKSFAELTKKSGVIIMGRTTHESIGKVLPERLNIVYTNNPEKYESTENLIFTNNNPEILLSDLYKKGYRDISIIGGSKINSLFLNKNLVDYVYITIAPVLISGKNGLFDSIYENRRLKLIEVHNINENTLRLKYKILGELI